MAKQQPTPQQANADAQAAAAKVQSIFGAFQSIASLGGTPTSAVAAFGSQVGRLAAVMGPAGVVAGSLITAVAGLPQLFKSAADSVQGYVAQFSPLTANRYTRAWADLNAAIGEQLMPVLNAATGVVRFFGDTIAGLTPIIKPVMAAVVDAVKPFVVALGDGLREIVTAWAVMFDATNPFVALVLDAVNPLRILTDMLRLFADTMRYLNTQLSLLLGVDLPKFEGASQGKAFVQTQTTSPSAMLQSIRERAYQLGGEAKEKPEDLMKAQLAIQKAIVDKLKDFNPETIGKRVGEQVAAAVKVAAEAGALEMRKTFDMLPNAVQEGLRKTADDIIKRLPGGGVPIPGLPALPIPAPAPGGGFNLPNPLGGPPIRF